MSAVSSQSLLKNIGALIEGSRQKIAETINLKIVETYLLIGELIVEFEQHGKARARYSSNTLKNLSGKLTSEFGRGFSIDNLENMRKFYLTYKKSETVSRESLTLKTKQKSETVSRKFNFILSWSHYVFLLRIENEAERSFYEIEAINENWSLRELKRQYNSALYERLVLSRNKKKIKELGKKGQVITSPSNVIKDPYILEFLTLKEHESYTEANLKKHLLQDYRNF